MMAVIHCHTRSVTLVNVQTINPERAEVRPVDLPELRAETARLLNDPRINGVWESTAADAYPRGNSADEVRRVFMNALQQADLFWVAEPMAELVETGARTVPAFTLMPEDVPSESGILIFERPITAYTAGEGTEEEVRIQMDGALWVNVATPAGGSGTAIFSLVLGKRLYCSPTGLFTLGHGQAMPDREFGQFDFFRAVRAAWLLMRQQLSETEDVEPDRASRKRQKRAGYEPRTIRIINLRRPKGDSGTGDSHGGYQHQWIVRGHWRNHWHPKRKVHRPVWIAPHVKGPEGAPMIGGEKVYAWKR